MPSKAAQVSTLADVIRLFQRVMSYRGDGTPIMVGKRYLEEPGPGNAPRIVFVPDDDENAKLGPALKISAGYVAGRTWTCDVAVRGADGDDVGRFENAYTITAKVVVILKALDPGHIKIGPARVRDDGPLAVGGAGGVGERFSFTYESNIAQDPDVLRAVAACITSRSPPNPDQPGGSTGYEFNVTAPGDPVRP